MTSTATETSGLVARRADVCALALAEAFRGDGEIVANPIGTVPRIGGMLARATFEPELVMTDGVALFVDVDGAVEGWNPYRRMFDVLWNGRRHVVMGASQLDQFGNQNLAFIGADHERPQRQLIGFRGAPGNTINHVTTYWVPNHGTRVLVPKVDVVCGIGYDRAAELGADAARFHELRRVVTDLAVLDFDTPDHRMRLVSVHPGVELEQVVAATGFELVIADDVADDPDPGRGAAGRDRAARPGRGPLPRGAGRGMTDWLDTRFCREFGVRYPLVQTGMGWVSGARLTAATAEAGALGILAAVTLSDEEMLAAVARVRSRTDAPFGVNLRPDQPDLPRRIDSLVEHGVAIVSFAGAPQRQTVQRLQAAGAKCIVTVGRPRHAAKMLDLGVDALLAQGAEGGGHTGDVPTSLLVPAVVDLAEGTVPVLAAGGFRDGRGLAAAIAWGAEGVAMGTRFLLTQESQVPDQVKQRYLASTLLDTHVSTTFDGQPLRILRNEASEQVEATSTVRRLVEAPRNVARVRRQTGQSWSTVVREGLAMRRNQGLTLGQTARAADAPMLMRRSLVEGDPVHGLLPTGMVAGSIDDVPTVAELIERIVAEARVAAARLGGDR